MKDEPCPACNNPLGSSLKALRDERDRLIPFVNQHRSKRHEILKLEKDLALREKQIQESENRIREKSEKLALTEDALNELMEEAQRPNHAFDELKNEYENLRQKMAQHIEQQSLESRKAAAEIESLRDQLKKEQNAARMAHEIATESGRKVSILTEARDNLSKNLDLLNAKRASEIKILEEAKAEISSLKLQNQFLSHDKIELIQQKDQLLDQKLKAEKSISSLQRHNQKLKGENECLESQISGMQQTSFVISDLDLLNALSQEVSHIFSLPSEIVTLGSGPFEEDEFDSYLRGIEVKPWEYGCPWIIVGRNGWTEEKLDELLDDEKFGEFRVFSQEMFVAGILTTHDPFSLPLEILMKFAKGHPALEYLIGQGFEWPEIILEEDYGEPVYLRGSWERVEESPLYRMGYQVGITHGQPRNVRRSILKKAYIGEIPEVEDDHYMEEWGFPGRSKRLWRIAHHIAWLIRSRHTIPSMRHAVNDWQDDLNWMEEQFYTNRMRFKWPHG